jgi:hypothetical protein
MFNSAQHSRMVTIKIAKSCWCSILLASVIVNALSWYSSFPSALSTGSRDSPVGISTLYELDGLGIESRWRRGFPHPSKRPWGQNQPSVQWVPGLSRGQSGRGVALTTHTHRPPRVKKELSDTRLPSTPSCHVFGLTLTLTVHWVPIGLNFSGCKGDRSV